MNDMGEISIGDKWIGSSPVWMRRKDGTWELTPEGDMLPAAEVLRQIEAHRQAGARVLFVTLGMCGGGAVGESLEIVAALRAWSRERGPVVAHVQGIIGSSGPLLAIAADLVVMAPKARLLFHAATLGQEPDPACTAELVPHVASRCAATEADVAVWLSRGLPGEEPVTIADPEAALANGLCDLVGELEEARMLARALAAGRQVPETPRGRFLRASGRGTPPAPAPSAGLLAATGVLQTGDFSYDANYNPASGARLISSTAAPAWGSATTYAAGDLVSSAGDVYRSLAASNTNHDPASSPTWWKKTPTLQVEPGGLQIGAYVFSQRFEATQLTLPALSSTVTWTFATAEPDTNYLVIVTAVNSWNAPTPNCQVVVSAIKSTGSLQIITAGQPNAGGGVLFDVVKFRI